MNRHFGIRYYTGEGILKLLIINILESHSTRELDYNLYDMPGRHSLRIVKQHISILNSTKLGDNVIWYAL